VSVLMEQPTIRLIDRRLFPSTSAETMRTRLSEGRIFILNNMPERS
jgi:hypothetical protein